MNEDAVREKLVAAVREAFNKPGVGGSRDVADALLPVVREIAAEELREAADELDDIAAHLDPEQRSVGTPRGYRIAAHHNRSIAAVLTKPFEEPVR